MDLELFNADNTTDVGTLNRYVLSGDLLAGRISEEFTKDLTTDVVTSTIEKYWYHLDHLNSTKCVTKSDGSLEVMYEYRAFGEQLKKLGEGEAKYTYGGKELDDQTNLYYFNARYYDATIGRFINVDPVQDGTNWYVYCNNNPLSFMDPTGLSDKDNKFDSYESYEIQGGDTLSEITRDYNEQFGMDLRIDEIAKHNNISDPNKIKAGSTLNFPVEKWTASENLTLTGFDAKVSGTGFPIKAGTSITTFSNGNSTFQEEFNVHQTDSAGGMLNAGMSITHTDYSRLFRTDTSRSEIISSFTEYFETYGASVPVGPLPAGVEGGYTISPTASGSPRLGNSWRGKTVGGSIGVGGGFGMVKTYYSHKGSVTNDWSEGLRNFDASAGP
jgi:RHS repeat-associated protein